MVRGGGLPVFRDMRERSLPVFREVREGPLLLFREIKARLFVFKNIMGGAPCFLGTLGRGTPSFGRLRRHRPVFFL